MIESADSEQTEAGATVLVVDDDVDVRQVVRYMLRRGGHRIVEAEDGAAAVERVRELRSDIDVVLLDVMMPRMTGHEALPAIRDLEPRMPVVLFSGYDRSEVAQHLDAQGAHTAFLAKPFDSEGLLAAIDEALNASAAPGANGRS